jgi:hypothetical protein
MSWKRSTVSMLALLAVAATTAVFTSPGNALAQATSAPPAAAPGEAAKPASAQGGAAKPASAQGGAAKPAAAQGGAAKPASAQGGAAKPAQGSAAQIKRGEYLVTIAGCHDCHTPMKMTPLGLMPDFERALMGHPPDAPEPTGTPGKSDLALTGSDLTSWKMPYGLVYSRNLTPHKSGLGEWTEAQFIKSLREGRHQGEGRPLLAPMPWAATAAMTEEDLKALYAYLRTIKPISNTVPDPKVPPPVIEQFAKNNAALAAIFKGPPPGAAKPAPAGPKPSAPATTPPAAPAKPPASAPAPAPTTKPATPPPTPATPKP